MSQKQTKVMFPLLLFFFLFFFFYFTAHYSRNYAVRMHNTATWHFVIASNRNLLFLRRLIVTSKKHANISRYPTGGRAKNNIATNHQPRRKNGQVNEAGEKVAILAWKRRCLNPIQTSLARPNFIDGDSLNFTSNEIHYESRESLAKLFEIFTKVKRNKIKFN